ncbi:MAG: TonB-dependent receptor [Flavobacteriales bacterium]|nr:MAG: TonB-dependent receptor [Flavobacteriales bacterium]
MKKLLLIFFLLIVQVWIFPLTSRAAIWTSDVLLFDRIITGTVTDVNGQPIPGANVQVKGTKLGTTTDGNGKFSLSIPDNTTTITISYIGFIAQDQNVGSQTSFSIRLQEEQNLMNEVVVVGYGTQKKVNLVGAVTSIQIDEKISNRSISNVSSALSGLAPGLAVQQSGGLAGNNNSKLLIRGLSTPNSGSTTNPLIVVDGIMDVDINTLDMNDIENISVLKDAAAAVYGSRGATGVILITTKTGKGLTKSRINYTGTYGTAKPTNFYDILDDYAQALNLHIQATRNGRVARNFLDGSMEEWLSQSMVDPIKFPNVDQFDYISRRGNIQNHNISAAGASEKGNYFLSVGVYDETGILVNNDANRYNFRMNGDYNIRKNVTAGIRATGSWTNQTFGLPNGFSDYGNTNAPLVFAIAGILPYNEATQQYGGAMAYGEAANTTNLLAEINGRKNMRERQEFNGGIYLGWTPIPGLTARFDYALNYYNQFQKSYTDLGLSLYNFQTGGAIFELFPQNSPLGNTSAQGFKTQVQARLDYTKELFKGHQLSLLAVASEEYWLDRGFGVSVGGRLDERITEIINNSANTVIPPSVSGNSTQEGMRSFIGRLNYSIDEKYLLEATFRADGSSKFTPGNQWGYFPSILAGWRFSEEKFFSPLKKIISSGKLRFSYGSLGNNSGVSRYEQLNTFISTPYILNGNNSASGISANKNVNPDFSWEETTSLNIGLDLGFFDNKLTAEIDAYDRVTTDLIRPSSLSTLLTGLSAPRINIGTFRNYGIELNLTWKSNINKFNYGVTGNFAYNLDRLEEWNQRLNFSKNFIDMPWFFSYQMQSLGIAQTWNDIYNAPFQGNANVSPGDLLYKDLNGNGQVDSYDKVAQPTINEQRPTANYGANLFASYKGFDFSVLFQASTGRKDYFLEDMTNVNIGTTHYAFQRLYLTDIWNVDNRGGVLPRIVSGNSANNRPESDFWLQSMDYLRLKNMQLGYNVPQKFLKKLGVERIKIYGSAENLFTITKWQGIDPEKSTLGNGFQNKNDDPFPILRSISFGLNVGL